MVHITTSFLALLSLSGTALASVSQIKVDITSVGSIVTTLNTALTNFPSTGGTLVGALAIHTDTAGLISAIITTTGEVTTTAAFSVTDGTSILAAVKAVEPTILSALKEIIAKKAALVALPLGGIPKVVHQDLMYLNGNATLLANGLIKNCPATLVQDATSLKTSIGSAIAVAITAYAAYA